MAHEKLNLAVLISGAGSNLQALIDACAAPDFPAIIRIVISNRPDAGGLARAQRAGIPTAVVDHACFPTRDAFERALNEALAPYPVDLLCLAGFMRILTSAFVEKRAGKMINIHPSLLPAHGGEGLYGRHVHRSVLEAGDAETGVSVHYVIPECDRGDIILQRRIPVLPGDTEDSLSRRVLEQEHIAYPQAVRLLAEKRQNGT